MNENKTMAAPIILLRKRAAALDSRQGTLKPSDDSAVSLVQDAYDLGKNDARCDPTTTGGQCDLCGNLAPAYDAYLDRIVIKKYYRQTLEEEYRLDICTDCRNHLENHMFTMKMCQQRKAEQ